RKLPLPENAVSRRDGRVAEGARLESVFRGNSNVGSNPTLSAILLKVNDYPSSKIHSQGLFSSLEMSDMQFCGSMCVPLRQTGRLPIIFLSTRTVTMVSP